MLDAPNLALLFLGLIFIGFACGKFKQIPDTALVYTAILMAALPPALNVYVFAQQYDTWVEQASSSVLFGTLASVGTLTVVMWLVKTHHLPQLLFL